MPCPEIENAGCFLRTPGEDHAQVGRRRLLVPVEVVEKSAEQASVPQARHFPS
jgi:hypothetical protein